MAKATANGWTKEHIQYMLDNSHKAVERALIQIYRRQTADEQQSQETREHNGVGFTGFDGNFLSEMAQKCLKYQGLTARQVEIVRPKMKKYWRQLLEIAATSDKSPSFEAPAPVKASRKPKQLALA